MRLLSLPVPLMLINFQGRLQRPLSPGALKAVVGALLCTSCCPHVAALWCRSPTSFSPGLTVGQDSGRGVAPGAPLPPDRGGWEWLLGTASPQSQETLFSPG